MGALDLPSVTRDPENGSLDEEHDRTGRGCDRHAPRAASASSKPVASAAACRSKLTLQERRGFFLGTLRSGRYHVA